MTYLELCRELVRELGIAGGTGPATVANQTGELANVVRWIRDGNDYINNLWRDWKFLWAEYDQNVTGVHPPMPVGVTVREWHRDSFWLQYGTAAGRKLVFQDWNVFRVAQSTGASVGTPTMFTIKPNNTLALNRPPPATVPLHAEYWKRPDPLVNNADVPDMPAEYHRIIMVRAAIMYGNREAAGEIISGMEAEYTDLLEKLQSDQLDAFRYDRLAGQDIPLYMEIQ